MATTFFPTTEEIDLAFTDEITTLGGAVADRFDDGSRLYLRALLSSEAEVRPSDAVRAGIALRASGPIVAVHPYTMRQICVNGAIAAHVKQSRHVTRVEYSTATEFTAAALDEIRLTTRECARPEVFQSVVDEMRAAAAQPASLMLQVMPLLTRYPEEMRGSLLQLLMEEFAREDERTTYGVMNAVTAAARETRDPEMRWGLEEYGAALGAVARRMPRLPSEVRELISV